jgi:dihydroorotate dehydrogenase
MLEAETAWRIGDLALQHSWFWKIYGKHMGFESPNLETELAGMKLRNPIGLAAGYDKNCKLIPALSSMGFGYLVTGTVTKEPKVGNPKPRVIRKKNQNALINALGFPGHGLKEAKKSLSKGIKSSNPTKVIVSVSGVEIEEILECHAELEPLASAIEINISSPNTAGLRAFQNESTLSDLLYEINSQKTKPLLIKMPPFINQNLEDKQKVLGLAQVCVENDVEALTVSNTLPVEADNLAIGRGGLSGSPLFDNTLKMVSSYKEMFGNNIGINACGGISDGKQAFRLLNEGACTLQLLTALVYEGPSIVTKLKKELAHSMTKS